MKNRPKNLSKYKPWIGSLVLLPVYIYYAVNRGEYTFIDNFNLLIHEGGHGIFRFFGDFIYTLGGTLMQIILPVIFTYYFYSNKKRFGVQVSVLWLGQNLMNIAVYAADARVRKLPLLGGSKVYHDWHWMLGRLGVLEYDTLIGHIFYGMGIVMFITSFLMPLIIRDYEVSELKLKL